MRISVIDYSSALLILALYQFIDLFHFCAHIIFMLFLSQTEITAIISNRFFLFTFLLKSNVTINSFCRIHTKKSLIFHNYNWQFNRKVIISPRILTTHRNKSHQCISFVHRHQSLKMFLCLNLWFFEQMFHRLLCFELLKINTWMCVLFLLLKPNVCIWLR